MQKLGCALRSKLILERDRDEKGKLTHWLTGRRIIYVSVPRDPLPKFIQVGPFKASVYHREQKNILREAAANCRNCLQKGQHKTADCPNPVKCRQCLTDGHRAGDLTSVRLFQKRTTTPMSTTPAPSSPRPRTPRTRQTNVKHTSKTRPLSSTTQPDSTRRAAPHRPDNRCPLQREVAAHDARTAPTPPVTTR